MKTKKTNYYKETINILKELHQSYPTYNLGRHISTALSDYPDIWDLSDKEFHFALSKYQAELTLTQPEDLTKIISDGMNLDNILDEDEYDGYE